MTPAIPPMTHVLKANNVSTNYKAAVRNRSVAWNERSEQRLIAVQRDRRWTKQRDTQRGDIIRCRDLSLASSQSGHRAAFGWTHWSEKWVLLLVNSSCAHGTHLYAQTYVVTQSWSLKVRRKEAGGGQQIIAEKCRNKGCTTAKVSLATVANNHWFLTVITIYFKILLCNREVVSKGGGANSWASACFIASISLSSGNQVVMWLYTANLQTHFSKLTDCSQVRWD